MRILSLLLVAAAAVPAHAGLELEPGHLLLQPGRYDYFLELTPDGGEDDWIWAGHDGHGLAVAADGRILFAKTGGIFRFDPVTYEQDAVPNGGGGGGTDIAAFREYAFVTSYQAARRVRLSDGATANVVTDLNVADVNVGLDGLVYVAVRAITGSSIQVFDPLSLEPIRTIPLGDTPCAVAATATGEPIVFLCNGRIERRSAEGALLDSLQTGRAVPLDTGDLDVSLDGRIAAIVGGAASVSDSELILSDLALDDWRSGGHSGIHDLSVAFYASESCHNGIDDDADGYVDADDPEAACCGFGDPAAELTIDRARLVPAGPKSRVTIEATLRGADLRNPALEFYFFLHDLRKETHQGLSIMGWRTEPKPSGWLYKQKRRDPLPGTLAIDRVRFAPKDETTTRISIVGGAAEIDVPRAGRVGVSIGFRNPNGDPDLCAAAVEKFEARDAGIGFRARPR
jgi:hypothetical protein